MSEQGIRAFRPFGRHFWLVVAAVLTLAAGTSVALAVSGSVPGAQANHCPGLDFQSGETQEINGVNVTVTFSGDSGTVTAAAPFTGTISIFGGGDTQEIPLNITEAGGSQNFTFSSDHDISHVCIFGQAAPPPDDNGPPPPDDNGPPPDDNGQPPDDGVGGTETVETIETVTETTPGGEVVTTVPSGEVAGVEEAAPAAAQPAPSQLAFTGLSAIPLALIAGAMLALGFGLLRAGHRTR